MEGFCGVLRSITEPSFVSFLVDGSFKSPCMVHFVGVVRLTTESPTVQRMLGSGCQAWLESIHMAQANHTEQEALDMTGM